MKKKFALIFLVIAFVCILAAFKAPEKTDAGVRADIKSACLGIQNIKDAESVVLGDSCVLALKTAPIFVKSGYDAIGTAVAEYFGENHREISNIYISYDLDVFIKTAALSRRIENDGNALLFKDDIFYLINLIESRK